MSRPRALPAGGYDPVSPVKEPLLTRSLAAAVALGAPVGIVVWLAWQQMSNITWMLSRFMQHVAQ
jgi:hypothetical protein